MPTKVQVHPYKPFADHLDVQGTQQLTKGASRLWELLHHVGVYVADHRHYHRNTSSVVYSLPQSLVAWTLGYTDRHVRNLQGELEAAGLLDSSPLAARVNGENLWASTLWAVKLTTKATMPRLTPEDFQHRWRDFQQDLRSKNTAQSIISGLKNAVKVVKERILEDVATLGIFRLNPPLSFSPEHPFSTLRDSVYSLSLLAEIGPETSKAVDRLAGAFSRAFGDEHSFLWWCSKFWSVVGSWERVGTLQAQLHRVLADMEEFSGIRNCAAWLNKRLTSPPLPSYV